MIRYIIKKGLIMVLTYDDIIKKENEAFAIYQDLQATLAGQSLCDVDVLESDFNEIADDLGTNTEDLYEKMESFHEQYMNR